MVSLSPHEVMRGWILEEDGWKMSGEKNMTSIMLWKGDWWMREMRQRDMTISVDGLRQA